MRAARTDANQPWTWRQFHAAMKAAGWERMDRSDPAKCYVHSVTGRKFYPYDFVPAEGENWRKWAVAHETPSPFWEAI